MKHFFLTMLVSTFIVFTFLPSLKAQENNNCLIARRTDGHIALVASEAVWDVSIDVEGYALSSSHNHIAVPFDSTLQEAQIGIYRVTESGLQEQAILENTRIIRGSGWSDDGNKLILQNSYSDHLIYLYDLPTSQLIPLTDDILPTLQIHQVAWTPDNEGILFVATESPLPTTEYGRNGVVALYHLDLNTLNLTPISKPDENVDWYFDSFVALTNNRRVYSSCPMSDDEPCSLNIVSANDTISINGTYNVQAVISQDTVLVYRSSQANDEATIEFEILLLSTNHGALNSILTIPTILDFPVPIMSLSPDKGKLAYMVDDTSLAIIDIPQMTNRLIASLDSPISVKWHPNSDELLYWTDNGVYTYKYATDETELIQSIGQDSQPTEFMWLCINE
jgi:WD40 repeat protein